MAAVTELSIIRFIRDAMGAAIATTAGLLVWALSPGITGTALPWDATWPFYSSAFLATGLIVSQVAHRMWPCVIGAWAGQVAALIALPLDRTTNMWGETAWWVLGIVATGVGSLIVAAGWMAGRAIRKRLP